MEPSAAASTAFAQLTWVRSAQVRDSTNLGPVRATLGSGSRDVNARRALGADCRTEGTFAPAGAVDMEPHLRCAARLHSLYLAAAGTLTYDTPGGALGETLWETVTGAGHAGVVVSQTLGSGFDTAESLIDMLLSSDRDCATLMHPDATQIGIGHSGAGSGMFAHTWTIVLGHE
jgi:uncharacterized protein YkwD